MFRDPERKVCRCEGRPCSIRDLLAVFLRPDLQQAGVPRVSDLHVRVGAPPRLRIDGDLFVPPESDALTREQVEALLYPLLGDEQIAALAKTPPTDVDGAYDWRERGASFRINAFVDRDGPAAVVRVLPRSVPPPWQIGFPDERVWREIVSAQQGLVIVTGVTGSGKSTTIASLLGEINRTRPVRIVTLEDPIEYVLADDRAMISQRQVGMHVASFADGLRSSLREDPDVIFVGEMRDRETAGLALTAAETGHLVFSTLHTRDTRGALTRIVDLFPPERFKELCAQLSFSASWIIGQKLVTRADGAGRAVAMEVLRNTPAIANLIRTGVWQQIQSMVETQARDGMNTFERHLAELVRNGIVSREEAVRHVADPGFAARLG
ncbi:type IV pilus twitching motility protein PilT [Opitutales bacterium ASA1]|uniref:type IV pilus twitching motility protein PilT n=1 Tax=Congregicoccus parvus TaxID=3081749 RepID=UPI002B2FDE9F|nr:type IV pilus twitching motility protein PilT [Opitutales bacterium ASA1]